jgi:hypothetical protein
MRKSYEFGDDAIILIYYFLNIKLYEKKIFFNTIKKIIIEKYFDKPKGKKLKWLVFLDANGTWEELAFNTEAAFNKAEETLNKKSTAGKKIITENRIFSIQVLHEKERYPLCEFFPVQFFILKNGKEESYNEVLLKDGENLVGLITVAGYQECLMVIEQFKKKIIEKLKDVVMTEKLLNYAEIKRMRQAVRTENFMSLQGSENNEMKMLTDEVKKSL